MVSDIRVKEVSGFGIREWNYLDWANGGKCRWWEVLLVTRGWDKVDRTIIRGARTIILS